MVETQYLEPGAGKGLDRRNKKKEATKGFETLAHGRRKMGGGVTIFRSGIAAWRGISSAATVRTLKDTSVLFRQLAALGLGNSNAKVADVLDDWVREGNPLHRPQVISFATQLRRFHKPHLALQLYQWMDERKKKLNNADRALRIDLLSKTEGIASAENYFDKLVESAKTRKTYGALLSCYCHGKMLQKATELFQKMTNLNFHTNALNYNNMMALYMKVGLPEKVPVLFQEMEESISPDLYSYNQLMNSYAAINDIDAVEGVLERMKSKKIKFDWLTFGNLANIYFKAGLLDKARTTLEELEKWKISKDPEAFYTLMNLYSRLSDATGVTRAWELYKLRFTRPNNTGYLLMHLALSRLSDYEGLEKLYKEWESVCFNHDIRIHNVLLDSYLKRGMIEEATLLYDSVIQKGVNLNLRTYSLFMMLSLKKRQIGPALQTLEVVASRVSSQQNNWFPDDESVNEFLKYIIEENDAVAGSNFCEIMKKLDRLDVEIEKMLNEVCSS